MTNEEFDLFYARSISSQTSNLMDTHCMIYEDAHKQATDEIRQMLSDKMNTPNHYLMTIETFDAREVVGFVWTLHELTDGRKQNFICDFRIVSAKGLCDFSNDVD